MRSSIQYSITIACVVALLGVLSFFANAGVLWLICWAFRMTWWSWRVCIGVWLLEILLETIFKARVHK